MVRLHDSLMIGVIYIAKARLDEAGQDLDTVLDDQRKLKDAARILASFQKKISENVDLFVPYTTIFQSVMKMVFVEDFLMKVHVPVDLEKPEGGSHLRLIVVVEEKWFICESVVPGVWKKFTANEKFHRVREKRCEIFHTLMHWSVFNSGGEELLCDLQGSYELLSDPEIYGSGTETMRAFEDHQCNIFCTFMGMAEIADSEDNC